MEPNEYVKISREHYKSLLDDQLKLNCLENAGVDNWCGYDFAMEEYRGEDDDD